VTLLHNHCPVDVRVKIAQDIVALEASAAQSERKDQAVRVRRAPAPPRPVFCDTTPKAYGGSTTDCF
jgi:hypothetical protein